MQHGKYPICRGINKMPWGLGRTTKKRQRRRHSREIHQEDNYLTQTRNCASWRGSCTAPRKTSESEMRHREIHKKTTNRVFWRRSPAIEKDKLKWHVLARAKNSATESRIRRRRTEPGTGRPGKGANLTAIRTRRGTAARHGQAARASGGNGVGGEAGERFGAQEKVGWLWADREGLSPFQYQFMSMGSLTERASAYFGPDQDPHVPEVTSASSPTAVMMSLQSSDK